MSASELEQKLIYKNGKFENINEFGKIMEHLKVINRARPIHKEMIVNGLKELGKKVIVTGDSINDQQAIKAADVGLAMGSGCSAAKEVSDVILTTNDFEATIRAIMWGRNIYHNVGRFL
jgi:P-type E1-E2 ATPase